ncbi:hypothetical protein [Agrobacterium deltaense]|uniref:Uncharacterized protein n=2 Tax=Agrobacterium TaxID=357 RepID=A0A1S7UBS2_9HYPH|nr:hypothetical protein [Agrobacterium deltaense]CVI64336.1 hypothetical protein AGR7A_pTi0072 [Agrobacterium deltaense NCPPB 1641]
MEDACRQTRHQIAMIERQITARMTALIRRPGHRRSGYRRGRPPEPKSFLCRYRANLAAMTAERQPEIDALSRKLARQEAAIAPLRALWSAGLIEPDCRALKRSEVLIVEQRRAG